MVSTDTEIPNTQPPISSILVISTIWILCLASVPSVLSTIDEVATVETCTLALFPDLVSRSMLGYVRLSFALFIFSVTAYRFNEKEYMIVNYMKQSKLKAEPIYLGGIRSQMPFTSWSWNLLGTFFALSGSLTLFVDYQDQNYPENMHLLLESSYMKWALRSCILLFEVSAPTSMLVSAVVKYALWPKALAGNGTQNLKRTAVLLQHNANIYLSLIEVALLGGLPIRFNDLAVAPIFGVVYVLFAWSVRFRWVPSGQPQFIYFFLDTTLGEMATKAILVLLFVLILFYVVFMFVDDLLLAADGDIWKHVAVVFIVGTTVCRFRD